MLVTVVYARTLMRMVAMPVGWENYHVSTLELELDDAWGSRESLINMFGGN